MPRKQNLSQASDVVPLFEFSNVVNSSLDLSFILGTVLLTVMGKMLVSKGVVLLKKEKGIFEIVTIKGLDQSLLAKRIAIDRPFRAISETARFKERKNPWIHFFHSNGLRLLVPIVVQRKIVGLLSLGERLSGKEYSVNEQKLIKSLVNLSGSAIEKAIMVAQLSEVNRTLDQKNQEVYTLFELSKEFNGILEAEKIIRLLTFSLLGHVGVNKYAICLRNGEKFQIVASRIDDDLSQNPLLEQLCTLKNATLVTELRKKLKYSSVSKVMEANGIEVVIPMMVQNKMKGAILLGNKLRGGAYSDSDLEFLYSLGSTAIVSIENARLFREEIQKQKMEDELKLAREIQQGLLPLQLPEIENFEIAAINDPSLQVGGDYYDVIKITPEEYVAAIGDVSGKGTGAALLMANVQAAFRAFAPMGLSLSEATGRINDLVCGNTGQSKFITFFWGSLNAEKRIFRYVNAGHNPPYLLRNDGTLEKLDVGGIILGLLNTTAPYPEGTVTIQPGESIVMFTDGVSEAMNDAGEDFTEARLEQVLREVKDYSAKEIIQRVLKAVEAHTLGTPQSDDITMLVIKAL
ncbi:MAG: SpoIIE family protein phosphatase [bacterium]